MDEAYAIKTLKRVHDAAIQADEEGTVAVVDQYNEALELLQSEYPDNSRISGFEKITANIGKAVVPTEEEYMQKPVALEKVKLKTEQIADVLDLGDGFERPADESGMQQIVIEQNSSQSNTQEVNQDISFEAVMQLIEYDPQVQQNKDEVEELVKEFQEELEKEDCDPDVLRKLISEVKDYSASVGAKLAMLALQKGVVGILGV